MHDIVVPEDRYQPALAIHNLSIKKLPEFHPTQSYFNFRKADYQRISDFFLHYN